MSDFDPVRIGVVSISDRASSGVYQDQGIPALKDWLSRALKNPVDWHERLIPDEQDGISAALRELVDDTRCDLVLTTGGTGFAPDDITPEATLSVADRLAPGVAEAMRLASREHTDRWMLARNVAAIRGSSLIVNFPGSPKAIGEAGAAIAAALPHAIELLRGEPSDH